MYVQIRRIAPIRLRDVKSSESAEATPDRSSGYSCRVHSHLFFGISRANLLGLVVPASEHMARKI